MKILLVDDSVFIQRLLKKSLESNFPEGEIITASDGLLGFSTWKQNKPDIIITDLLMPNMNGSELIKEILKNDSKARIIVFSADVQTAVKEEVLSSGVIGFINKPINENKINEMCRIIREAVSHA